MLLRRPERNRLPPIYPRHGPKSAWERCCAGRQTFILLVRGVHGGIALEELKAHAGWDQLAAIREGHVIYMGERLFHPSPVVLDALEELAQQLHPEAFAIRR